MAENSKIEGNAGMRTIPAAVIARRGRGPDRKKRTPGFTVTRIELNRLIFCCATGPGATGPYGIVTSGFAGMENDPETTSYPVACALVRLLRAEAFTHPGLFPKETQREVIAAR